MRFSRRFHGRLSRSVTRALTVAAGAALFGAAAQTSFATGAPTATGTVSTVSTGALNTYALTLKDASGSPSAIGSVWEAWIPGQFYMTSVPSSITSPTGWTSNIVTAGGGSSIQWIAGSAAVDVPIGGSLSGFGFSTPDSPANIDGASTVVSGVPTLTSVAYEGGLFSDGGTTFAFTPTAVPEPVSLAVLAPTTLLLMRRRSARSL